VSSTTQDRATTVLIMAPVAASTPLGAWLNPGGKRWQLSQGRVMVVP
jgi:hypothetical protein